VDAHVRQLGDDDAAKRKAAIAFLNRVTQESRGLESASVFVKVNKACRAKRREMDKLRLNQAVAPQDIAIYDDLIKARSGGGGGGFTMSDPRRPYFALRLTDKKAPHCDLDRESWENLRSILGGLIQGGQYWGVTEKGEYQV